MMSESKQKGKTQSTLKRMRYPYPVSSVSAKAGTTPSTSGTGGNNRKKKNRHSALCEKFKGEEVDSDDLTRDMEDPPSDTNLREVNVPKTHPTPGGSAPSAVKKDGDLLPTKGTII